MATTLSVPERSKVRVRVRWALFRLRRAAAACLLAFLLLPAAAYGQKKPDQYGLIFGTVYGPDDRPLYGVPVKIRPVGQKKAKWEVTSDHRGEFAQRVPAGAADYIVWTDVDLRKHLKALGREDEAAQLQAHVGKLSSVVPEASAAPARRGREAKVHIDNDERADVGLHLRE